MKNTILTILLLIFSGITCQAQTKELADSLGQLGYKLMKEGENVKAAKAWEQALPLVEKHGKKYEAILTGLGIIYEEMGDQENLSRIMGLMEEHNKHELEKPCDEPNCMTERAKYYGSTGNKAMAKECFLKAMAMPMDDDTKVSVFESYAQFMAMTLKEYQTGAEHQLTAANLRKQLAGENEAYANSIMRAGIYYTGAMTDAGRTKAIECYQKAISVYQQTGNEAKLAKCRWYVGNAYSGLKEYGKAKELYLQAVAYYEANDKDSKDYPKLIERVATAEKFNKEYESSIAHYQQALKLFKERGMMEEYGNAENGLKLCYAYAKKDMDEASDGTNDAAVKAAQTEKLDQLIAEEKKGLEISRKYLGLASYAHSLANIASGYAMKEDYKEAISYYNQYMENIRNAIRQDFRLQSESERMKVWQEEVMTMEELRELPITMPHEKDVTSLAYDAELLSKGILLNSSIEFGIVLQNQGNKQLIDMYKQTLDNEAEIERLREEASSDADLEKILSLTQKNQQLQIQLNNGCKELDDFTKYISYNWKDVQGTLEKEDIAIEFSAVNMDFSKEASHMMALILTKDMTEPVAVTIWDQENIMKCFESDFQNNVIASLLNRVLNGKSEKEVLKELRAQLDVADMPFKSEWSLYLHYLEHKADTIKGDFLPDRILWLGYSKLLQQDEVLFTTPDAGNIVWGKLTPYLSDKKRIFFSASGLFNKMGIEYLEYQGKPLSEQFEVYRLSSTKELCYKHNNAKPKKVALFGDINYNEKGAMTAKTRQELASLRGSHGLDDLSNTRREIDEIERLLKGKGVKNVVKLRDTNASKEAFLKLTDTKTNLLHIATHGIYLEDNASTDATSMQNSLLAFAEAGVDSTNFASAADIANMNLRQCDLAVLSACETGLGKLGDDGVFGLQRGFKNAGVHTLLMSLKNVYDESTADLMISFYRNLMNGATKREALVKAQQEIRSQGFTDPKYWATFILLDAF